MGKPGIKYGAHPAENRTIICQYCSEPYQAKAGNVKYGCKNYDCNVAAEVEKLDYNRDRMRTKWGKTAKRRDNNVKVA